MSDTEIKESIIGIRKKIITGNSFPLSLIRRAVTIVPKNMTEYHLALSSGDWESFWGHENTLAAVKKECGFDLTPKTVRPALGLTIDGYPELYGKEYRECWILSPDYKPGFRPDLKTEVQEKDIHGWQVLLISWGA